MIHINFINMCMSSIEKFLDYLFTNHRWLVHSVYWLLVLVLYVLFFGRQNSNYLQTLFFVGLLMPVTVATTYFLNYFLLPRFLLKDQYFRFILYFLYTLVASIFLELMMVVITFIFLAEVNIRNMTPASVDTFFLMTSTLMVAFFGMAVKLLLHYKRSKEKLEQARHEKMMAELKFLKAQLNPHFLFNTLNNLYYLTIEKSDRAPEAVLHLSEILDYVLNASKVDFVPFEREWKQVQNYIALESLRYEDRVQVSVSLHTPAEQNRIAPMVLLTLVENAFKHGVMQVAGKSWIVLNVRNTPGEINIHISNSQRVSSSGHGIGLNNLRNQLDHIYSDQYTLTIEDKASEEQFAVNLKIAP